MRHLRAAVADWHDATERSLDLLRDDLSIGSYVACLRALERIVTPVEGLANPFLVTSPPVAAAGDAEPDTGTWTPIRRADALRDDLRDLGTDPADRAAPVGPIESRPAALGAAYVLEGSALGAKVIVPRLVERFGPDVPRRYFAGLAADAAPRWRAFRRLADRELRRPDDLDAATTAAVGVFAALHAVSAEELAAVDA
ncbi:MAG: biliverdin-producing heme oxygenase [Actinomycetota bacterium]|nr:biliverdin-producing heme oxygenase [Actinomycetota bacterium]